MCQTFYENAVQRSLFDAEGKSILSCGTIQRERHDPICENLSFAYYGSLLLLEGRGVYIDASGKEIPLSPGCFIQRLPGVMHSTVVESGSHWREFYICFDRDTYLNLKVLGILSDDPVLYPGLDPQIIQQCYAFQNTLAKASQEQLPYLLLEAQRLVIRLHELHKNQHTNPSVRMQMHSARYLLQTHLHSGKDAVYQVAQQLGVGYESFRKLFRAEYGIAPYSYLCQLRILHAKQLLIETPLPIAEVSFAIGYEDCSTFSRQFKKATGITPMQFRQIYGQDVHFPA